MKITEQQLSAYLDNALPPPEKAEVDRALADSPELRQDLAELKRLGTLLKSVPSPTPPAGFYPRVLEKAKPRPRARLPWTLSLLGAATAALVMVYVARESKWTFRSAITEGDSETEGYADRAIKTERKILPGLTAPASPRKTPVPPESDPQGRENSDERALASASTVGSRNPPVPVQGHVYEDSPMGSVGSETLRGERDASKNAEPPVLSQKRTVEKIRVPKSLGFELSEKQRSSASTPREWQGDSSGIADYREIVIKDDGAWAALWKEHQSHMGIPAPVPPINFKESMVVGLFVGERGSSGFTVQLTEMKVTKDEVVIYYVETTPASGGIQLTVMTQPYHLKIIPRSNVPVKFKKN
jgi:hypothetical protein